MTFYAVDADTVVLEPAMAPEVSAEAPLRTGTRSEEDSLRVPTVEVIGISSHALDHIPGSGRVVTKESIQDNRRFTINEALREVPGVHVRDEEGFGLRPNIGVRGLNPTRSSKIHIMEDGVPIMIMPYGDYVIVLSPAVPVRSDRSAQRERATTLRASKYRRRDEPHHQNAAGDPRRKLRDPRGHSRLPYDSS